MTIDERASGDVTILDVRGRMTIESVRDMMLASSVREQLDKGRTRILLNLEGVPWVDTTGLCNIVEAYVTTTRRGGFLKLLKPEAHVREVLVMTKLSTVMTIFDSEADAVASFGTGGRT